MTKATTIEKFCGALFVLFLALKLIGVTEVATWSWWAVFAPIWVPLMLLVAFS
jgi:p-aminobenzoyl-glutamate transporter AbgT